MTFRLDLLLIISVLGSIGYAQQSEDELIRSIFNTNPSSSCKPGQECVKRLLCTDNSTVNVFGEGLIGIRIDNVEEKDNDCGYLKVCCNVNSTVSKPITSEVTRKQHDGCGYRNKEGVLFKILGSKNNEAEFGEFPWMVAILRDEQGKILNVDKCGGALIAPTVVVTGAHCVKTKEARSLVIRAGEWDMTIEDEPLPHQERRVLEIITHENFNGAALFNDIALLMVESPFVLAENVRPLCLPPENFSFDGSTCFATGWGKETFEGASYKMILKKVELPIMERETCVTNLRTTRLGRFFQLHESFICAGGEEGKDTCKGDGGSPLVCPIPGYTDRFYHAGIVAWGIGCGMKSIPGVYANVAYLRKWIDTQLTSRAIDFQHFTA